MSKAKTERYYYDNRLKMLKNKNILSVNLDDGKIQVIVASEDVEVPEQNGVDFEVRPATNAELKEFAAQKADQIRQKYNLPKIDVDAQNLPDAINPNSVNAADPEAYKQWKERHSGINRKDD